MSNLFRLILFVSLITLTYSYVLKSNVDPKNGEFLFRANCNSCHQIGRSIAAPDLSFVSERWMDEERLIQFTKNPNEYLTNYPNDDYVNKMMEHWLPMGGVMPANSLSDNDVKDILAFIRSSTDTVTKFWSVNVALNHLERLKSLVLDTDFEKQLFLKNIKSFKHLKQLDIANLSIDEFELIKNNLNLEKLELRNTSILSPKIQLGLLDSLETLVLDNCSLDRNTLEFSSLKYLEIINDSMETLDVVAPNLIKLSIEDCHVRSLNKIVCNKTIKRLNIYGSSIIELDLVKNQLPDLIDLSILLSTVGQFEFNPTLSPYLKNIAIENVDLSKKQWLRKLDGLKLETLYLMNNKIEADLDFTNASFAELVELKVTENLIQSLTINLDECPKLEFIDLSQNQISDISWISKGTKSSLSHIRLHSNRIKVLPSSICNFDSLSIFSFENNLITEIPECLFKMQSLKRAYFRGNQIQKLNLSVEDGKRFESITIGDNPIDTTGFYQLNIDIGGHPIYKKLQYGNLY